VLAVAIALVVPAVQMDRNNAARSESANNLKQIDMAMHDYVFANQTLPPAGGGRGQHANLSWRVTLLPYITKEGLSLYNQFHLTEPWDSPHNKTLLEAMPRMYAMPGVNDPPGMTHYRVFVGPHAAFAPQPPGELLPRGRRFEEFTDGTVNTILVIEAADAVPWTKPEELEYAEDRPLPRLSMYGGCVAAMGDGTVRLLPPGMPEAEIRALITFDGGEAVDVPERKGKKKRS
jgi:type II secretory pathway pseudopilin PulG